MFARDVGCAVLVGIKVRLCHLSVQLGEFFFEGSYVGYLVHRI